MVAHLDILKTRGRFELTNIDLQMSRPNVINRLEEDAHKNENDRLPNSKELNHHEEPKIWTRFVKRWPIISQLLALLIIFILIWGIIYTIFPNDMKADSVIMRFVYLFVGAQISGIIVKFIYLPDMLGMLFWGVFFTNVGLSNFKGYEGVDSFLRDMALVNIMLLAGMGLDLKAFKKLLGMVMRLTLIPTVAEVVIIAVLAHFLLLMPWLWGFLLGFVITAVSPNVVVTVMLKLKAERLGLNNGLHTLIYAMTTCSDVLAIFSFGVILVAIFTPGGISEQLLQGPVGIGIGIIFGFIYGLLVLYLPSRNSKYVTGLRFLMTLLGGTISVMGSKTIGYPSAGSLGCVMIAFVASVGWRRQTENENLKVARRFNLLWKFLKPISFSLIGKEVNFANLDLSVIGYGFVFIIIGLFFRLSTSYLSTYGGGLTWKERAYVTISGFPKATIQAALGPIALDLARSLNSIENIQLANSVLVISVLAVVFTAPLGAVLMIRLAPVWLQKSPETPLSSEITEQQQTVSSNVETSRNALNLV